MRKLDVKIARRELVVPTMMLLCVGAYWADAAGLSREALAFPLALTAVVVLATAAVIATALISTRPDSAAAATGGWFLVLKTWTIVLLPVPLIYVWRDLGAIPALFVYLSCLLAILNERRKLWLVGLPALLAIALVYLFKTMLYVRLPDIPWNAGS